MRRALFVFAVAFCGCGGEQKPVVVVVQQPAGKPVTAEIQSPPGQPQVIVVQPEPEPEPPPKEPSPPPIFVEVGKSITLDGLDITPQGISVAKVRLRGKVSSDSTSEYLLVKVKIRNTTAGTRLPYVTISAICKDEHGNLYQQFSREVVNAHGMLSPKNIDPGEYESETLVFAKPVSQAKEITVFMRPATADAPVFAFPFKLGNVER